MSPPQLLRLVSKARYNEQTFLEVPYPTESLRPSSLRIQTILFGLGSNNLSYCANGTPLHWWDTFPTLSSVAAPYDNEEQYGVAPGWGYARVLESTIDEIKPGRVVYGFVPISSHAVDLQLRQSEQMPTHWFETSSHRSKVMNLYQRYHLQPESFKPDISDPVVAWTPVLNPVWGASHLLAHYVFTQSGGQTIHPFGKPISPWTEKEADLEGACIVCVGAGTKTSRSFLQQLAVIAGEQPHSYDVIEITGSNSGCDSFLDSVPFSHQTLSYSNISSSSFPQRKKFVIINFGGRGNAVAKAAEAVTTSNPNSEIVTVSVGGEAKVYSADEMQIRRDTAMKLKAVQMNATGIRDVVMQKIGEPEYFKQANEAFSQMVKAQIEKFDGRVLGARLQLQNGMRGDRGLEGAWNRLANGKIGAEEGILVQLGE